MPPYDISNQHLIVIACCTIHKFICNNCGDSDPLFRHALQEMYDESWINVLQWVDMLAVLYVSPGQRPHQSQASASFMGTYQNTMCHDMWLGLMARKPHQKVCLYCFFYYCLMS
jgi:hypothetical protein